MTFHAARLAMVLAALPLVAACQSDGSGSSASAGAAPTVPVESLQAYTGTWQISGFGGTTQVDVQRVGDRYVGYADRSLNGRIEATVETRLSGGKVFMDWDVDAGVESAPDITMECDTVDPGRQMRCTGWPMQPRRTWDKVSSAYLVEQRTGRSIAQALRGGMGVPVANAVSGGGAAASGSGNACWQRAQNEVSAEVLSRTSSVPSMCPSAKRSVELFSMLLPRARKCEVGAAVVAEVRRALAQAEASRDNICRR